MDHESVFLSERPSGLQLSFELEEVDAELPVCSFPRRRPTDRRFVMRYVGLDVHKPAPKPDERRLRAAALAASFVASALLGAL